MKRACTENGAEPTRPKRAFGMQSPQKTGTSKKARLEALLRRPKGATMLQLERSLGWQPHTVRAAISRLRKSGADVTMVRSGKSTAYRVVDAA